MYKTPVNLEHTINFEVGDKATVMEYYIGYFQQRCITSKMKLVKKVVKINQMKMFGCPFYHISDLFSVRIRVPSRALIF